MVTEEQIKYLNAVVRDARVTHGSSALGILEAMTLEFNAMKARLKQIDNNAAKESSNSP